MSTIKSSAENLTLNADGANNDIKFQSNGVEKASIDQDGKVTAGGASLDGAVVINESGADVNFRVESDTDANALSVDGGTGAVGIGTSTVANGASWGAILQLADSESCAISLHDTGGKQFDIGTSANDLYLGYDATSGAHRLSLNDAQVKIHTGDLIFGTAGKGVVLGATTNVDSNTLDDYEQGTWTCALKDASDNDSSYHSQEGSYTKIGDRVIINGNFYLSSASALSGSLYIKGLPFANNQSSSIVFGEMRGITRSDKELLGTITSTQVELLLNDGDGRNNSAGLQASAVGAATQTTFFGTYRTNV